MAQTLRMPLPARPVQQAPAARVFTRSRGVTRKAHRTMIYGPGGIGKTSLAALCPRTVIADIEGGSVDHDVERVTGIESFTDLRSWLQTATFDPDEVLCIDSITKAEEWACADAIANVRTPEGQVAKSIEDYGYGKGFTYVYERMVGLLSDLDRHYCRGNSIILIAHSIDAAEKNAVGEDYRRRRPRLQCSDKANVLAKYVEWCDHVLCLELDMSVKKGKANGGGSRTIYTTDTPARVAKSRTLAPDPAVYEYGDGSIWSVLMGTN
jgi:hypothetical protein